MIQKVQASANVVINKSIIRLCEGNRSLREDFIESVRLESGVIKKIKDSIKENYSIVSVKRDQLHHPSENRCQTCLLLPRHLGQNDVNSAEDCSCTMSGHSYIGTIGFTCLLTLVLSQTHMTPLEHKRRNLEESLLLGVVLHRINLSENAVNPQK